MTKIVDVKKWHEKGITGKNVVVWNMENNQADHGVITERRVLEAAPDATVISKSLSMSYNNDTIFYSKVEGQPIEDFIKENKIKIITHSVGGSARIGHMIGRFWNGLKEKYNLILITVAGNEADKGLSPGIPPDAAIIIGAAQYYANGLGKAPYSSIGDEVDFLEFSNMYSGTSFSAPYFAGKVALLCQLNPDITHDEVMLYFKEHAIKIEGKGTGYGYANLGTPDEVFKDLSALKEGGKTVIKLKIGSKAVLVDGIPHEMDTAAFLKDKRTFVPIRFVAEYLGAKVDWDEKTRTITITK